MYLEPELDDEVELTVDQKVAVRASRAEKTFETRDRMATFVVDLKKGLRGRVTYATYQGWFTILWDNDPTEHYRYEQVDLGTRVKIVKPRRGRKLEALDIAPFKGRD